MTKSVTEMIQTILTADNLPSLPAVALRVLDLADQADASTADIADAIEKDPALAARVLKMVNSSLFGLPNPVGSVQHATVVLGLRTVRVLALSFSLVESLTDPQAAAFDFQLYWRRSLTTAVLAKLVAEAVDINRRDEALVGGLLCDIGLMAAARTAPEQYAPVWQARRTRRVPVQVVEQEKFGITHATVGRELLQKWNLPAEICQAVATHHGEGLDAMPAEDRMLATTTYTAGTLADVFCGDTSSTELDSVIQRCAALTKIPESRLHSILERLDGQLKEIADLFSVSIGTPVTYQQLRDRAVAKLAALSLSAERENAQARSRLEEVTTWAEDLERRATMDPLTRVANRAAFDNHLKTTIESAERERGAVGLMMLDLDRFKELNDTFGHPAGDEALRRVGGVLNQVVQAPRMVARVGGEEFAVIVDKVTPREVRDLAEQIRTRVMDLGIPCTNQQTRLTVSVGVVHTHFQHELVDAAELVARADERLYDAKKGGRNRVEITY
jgi:diguanylate cyclase (GGDEF)-like protein/putative nucleotidyltransferase with HDIG domain